MTKQSGGTGKRRGRGFQRTSGLLDARIRQAGEGRGFAVSRVLTHWAEVVGKEVAGMARPVQVTYGRGGLGATLTLLTNGAQAPMVEMQKDRIRERVNACYGYAAISRIRITQTAPQTAPQGFAEAQTAFVADVSASSDPKAAARAEAAAAPVVDPGLRRALAALGTNVMNRKQH